MTKTQNSTKEYILLKSILRIHLIEITQHFKKMANINEGMVMFAMKLIWRYS